MNSAEQLKIKKLMQLKKIKKEDILKSIGSFDLSSNSYLDFQIHRTTDRNYLNTYKYNYKDTLESNIKIESLDLIISIAFNHIYFRI